MAGLTDMEELLGRVSNPEMLSYLREAYVCYGAGAYRACVVLTANALFDDLRHKTRAVATNSPDAAKISAAVEQLVIEQKPFETTLVERLTASTILSKAQGERLKQIIAHRNKAAHPSGVHAGAEEARWVFFEAIDKFLSQPVLSANQLVDALVAKLADKIFFPDTAMKTIVGIVGDEIALIHPIAFDYLVTRLVATVEAEDATAARNARSFLNGSARLRREVLTTALHGRFVKPKASNDALSGALMAIVSADPNLYVMADRTTKMRLAKSFKDGVKAALLIKPTALSHPTMLLANLVSVVPQAEILAELGEFVEDTAKKYYASSAIVTVLSEPGEVNDRVLQLVLERAASADFDVANKFAKALPDMDENLAEALSEEEALKVVAAVAKAARIGAFNSRTLDRGRFLGAPCLRERALNFLIKKPKSGRGVLEQYGFDDTAAAFRKEHLEEKDEL